MNRLGPTTGWTPLAVAVVLAAGLSAAGRDDASNRCAGQHLAIDAAHWTGLGGSGSWFLTVQSDGSAEVNSDSVTERFALSEQQCASLAQLLKSQRFLDLAGEYGLPVIDGPMRKMTVTLGKKQHSVVLLDDVHSDPDQGAVKRALRVWVALRSLFDVPDAVDSREQDRAVLQE